MKEAGMMSKNRGWYRPSALAATIEGELRAERRRVVVIVAVSLGVIGGALLLMLTAS